MFTALAMFTAREIKSKTLADGTTATFVRTDDPDCRFVIFQSDRYEETFTDLFKAHKAWNALA
jgi:hypothetical protein